LSVSVQLIALERLVSEMTCYVLSGMLNPTYSDDHQQGTDIS